MDPNSTGPDWASIIGGIETTIVGTVQAINQPTVTVTPAPVAVAPAASNNTVLLLGVIVVAFLIFRR